MQDLEQILSSRNLAFNIEIYIITQFGTVRLNEEKEQGHFEEEDVECSLFSSQFYKAIALVVKGASDYTYIFFDAIGGFRIITACEVLSLYG
jgi:hypothetical protein